MMREFADALLLGHRNVGMMDNKGNARCPRIICFLYITNINCSPIRNVTHTISITIFGQQQSFLTDISVVFDGG